MDVNDCKQTLETIVAQHSDSIDVENLFYLGGSHGGFLGGHLIAHEFDTPKGKRRFRAATLRNPVINIASSLFLFVVYENCF